MERQLEYMKKCVEFGGRRNKFTVLELMRLLSTQVLSEQAEAT